MTVHVHCLAELRSTFRATFCALFVAAVAGALLPASVEAQTYEVLHGFSVEGGSPRGALLLAADGSLYGTTESGGRFGLGSVFVLRPNGVGFDFSTVYEFSGADGAGPSAGLAQGVDGAFFGTTAFGGSAGAGTVFRIDSSGSLTSLHHFAVSDGRQPGALVQGSDGNFYGTTLQGGTNGWGTAFRINSAGSLMTLHSFTNGADGVSPGGLVRGNDGNFYGTAGYGVSSCICGVIFRIDGLGSLTTLHTFTGFDGSQPVGLIQGSDGYFYGTTYWDRVNGWGTIFRMDTSGSLTTLHQFTLSDGVNPLAGLLEGSDGSLYGTTTSGGANGAGTIFKIDRSGSLTVLHSFLRSNDGWQPRGELIQGSDGSVFGTSYYGGGSELGTVFRIDASGFTTLHTFTNSDGFDPYAGVIQGNDGDLYGTTIKGGASGNGTVFRTSVVGSLMTLHSFGSEPTDPYSYSGLVQGSDGGFYGTTVIFGDYDAGTVFRIDSSGSLTTLHSFAWDSSDGAHPVAELVEGSDGNFYGMTKEGGTGYVGTIFRIDRSGLLTTIHTFTGDEVDGALPVARLIQGSDGSFYGTTPGFGSSNRGRVFRVDTAGSLTTLNTFTGSDGGYPVAGLVQSSDGSFYGTTSGFDMAESGNGAIPSAETGTVFRIDTSGVLTTLHRFSGTDGGYPTAGLVNGSDGNFYGTTSLGGANGYGTVFRINSVGSLTTLHHFTGSDGANPSAGLVQGSDGRLYGTTRAGGPYNGGVVFGLTLPPNTPAGSNVPVQDSSAPTVQLTFDSVATGGTTTVVPIDPATAGDVPGGFAIVGSVAYQIQTTAVFAGPVTIAFIVPDPITEADFNSLVVLHNENGVLVDVTAASPARNYATRTIYAVTSSFSPFYMARTGPHISTLFDQTKAYKSGSTVPIKLRLLSASNANISSPSTALTVRHLSRIGGNTSNVVLDSGHANPDGNFRYDATLGGYIFNLSTKGLTPGTWVLSFSVGGDGSFVYLVGFDVK